MAKIIKRGGKFYSQTIEEQEVELEDLEMRLIEARKDKVDFISKETKDRDNQISEIKDEINQIKKL